MTNTWHIVVFSAYRASGAEKLVTSSKEVRFLPSYACLSLTGCQCNNSGSLLRILMKYFGRGGPWNAIVVTVGSVLVMVIGIQSR